MKRHEWDDGEADQAIRRFMRLAVANSDNVGEELEGVAAEILGEPELPETPQALRLMWFLSIATNVGAIYIGHLTSEFPGLDPLQAAEGIEKALRNEFDGEE